VEDEDVDASPGMVRLIYIFSRIPGPALLRASAVR
jgi:hypothetical protein